MSIIIVRVVRKKNEIINNETRIINEAIVKAQIEIIKLNCKVIINESYLCSI